MLGPGSGGRRSEIGEGNARKGGSGGENKRASGGVSDEKEGDEAAAFSSIL